MALTEDLSAFFDTDEFAEAGTITRPGDDDFIRTAKPIIDRATEDVENQGSRVVANAFIATCKTADIDGVKPKDILTAGAIAYRIESVSHEGTGVSYLELNSKI